MLERYPGVGDFNDATATLLMMADEMKKALKAAHDILLSLHSCSIYLSHFTTLEMASTTSLTSGSRSRVFQTLSIRLLSNRATMNLQVVI